MPKKGQSHKMPARQSSFQIDAMTKPFVIKSAVLQKGKANPFAVKTTNLKDTSNKNAAGKQEQVCDKEMEAKFNLMLKGKMDNLPHLPRSVVRIFISSTFSDMRAERNILSYEVFPKLKQFCLSKDLDFQVVDMRWGVTEDSQNDHSVEKICLQEVENCQQMSLGPNFVAIMGDRYGFRPIPIEISEEVFQSLKESAERIVKKPHAIKLMETWYKLDENCQPPKYILQPIRSQFSFFGDYSPGCDEPRTKHTQEWESTFADLRDILKTAALFSHGAKKLTDDQLREHYLSVTEIEIEKGILKADFKSQSAMVFHREIQGFTNFEDRMTKRHIDTSTEDGKVVPDKEVKYLQGKLEEKVKQKIDADFIHNYTVQWLPNGIDPKASEDHKAYLDNFCQDFYTNLKNMIESADDDRDTRDKTFAKIGYYSDYNEILHHLNFCEIKCRTFCGQENVLDSVKRYILDSSVRKPFVIYAPSGNGKTSVMAMIMQNLPVWLKEKPHVKIIRFLGTSALSLNIYDVLCSVCGQIADVAEQIMEPVGYRHMKNLQEYMPRFFRRISSLLKKPIIILLDSLDQLSAAHNAYELQWLPTSLPQNIRIVVSTLPREHGILDNLRAILPDKNCYVEIPNLPRETGVAIINKYLSKHNRKVTEYQEKVLINTFAKCPGPLFLKLILDEAIKWRSYTLPHQIELQQTVQGAINKLFDNLEIKFGKVIASHALGYITIARDGISENELEDVLSCDDEALDDVYRYHNPPVDGIIRIPPVLAARIRYDIKDYIVERISSDKYTMNWYHRQFFETAKNRYGTGTLGEKLHHNMAEIYMHENGIKKDITLSRRKLKIQNADRQITPQPVTWKNKRMLRCLPYHIIHAGGALSEQIAKEYCFCRLNFLSSKIAASGVESLVDELYEYLENQEDEEIKKLRNFFSLTKGDLSKSSRLAANILAHVNVESDEPYLRKLSEQATSYLENLDCPGLIPVYPGLAPRKDISSSLIHSYNGIAEIVSQSGDSVLVKTYKKGKEEENEFPHEIFHTGTQDLQQVNVPEIKQVEHYPLLDKAGKYVIYTSADSISLLHLVSGNRITKLFKDITDDPSKNQMVSKKMSTDTSHVVVLLDDGDILLIDTDSLMQIDRWTLKDEVEDVMGILCTKNDNLQVLVAVNGESGGKKTSEVQLYKPGDLEPKCFLFHFPLLKDLQGLSKKETFFTAIAEDGNSSKILTLDISRAEEMVPIDIGESIKQVAFSKSKPFACVLTNTGKVTAVDLQKSEILFHMTTDKPVTYFGISGTYSIVMLGDSDGSITLWNFKTGKNCGKFPAHAGPIQHMKVLDDYLVSHGQNEMKVWSLTELLVDFKETLKKNTASAFSGLMAMKTVISFDLHPNGIELVTASKDQMLRIWLLNGAKFLKEFDIGMESKKTVICANDKCCLLDNKGELKIINLNTTYDVSLDLPSHVSDFAIGKDGITLYTIGMKQKSLMVHIMDMKQETTKKSFPLKGSLKFETLDLCMSASERYLCIRCKILPAEYKDIEASWKKKGSFLTQVHPYKFLAVDLQQATGGLVTCMRELSTIPHLGEGVCAKAGNVMYITTRRWVVFWDIPTGKCDQRVCKNKDKGMMYRPCWFEDMDGVKGTSKAMVQSKDGHLLALGSEDGYLFIYNVESGYPIGQKAPATKHSASVIKAAFSPNVKWVASACQNNTIKLWDTSSGKEIFSTRVDAEVQQMKFSPNSKYLILLTGTDFTRVLIYRMHSETNKEIS
ncbi:NACHT domain- and WD repeat-containing protein 1-like [Ostrea edulis]|uniref:NACHT domain- and WD repeat-containing protein 1-like n=1 Tax=Ostrea edulis TaxID=37623 RepID=UPI0024AEE23A|nr:NACHT domain- and WD repeat-containing protein 1-like [Ostrea edulis]XP_056017278.1 NACHT domain- and WD repeat-containing protein 1-like [Ostrea edulis]